MSNEPSNEQRVLSPLEHLPAAYVSRRDVRFQEVDAAGILFFARIFEYVHDAYVDFLDSRGVRLPDVLRARDWGAPLKRATAEYLRPVRFGERAEVAVVRATWTGTSTVTLDYRVTVADKIVAFATTEHVTVDMKRFQRIDAPSEYREALSVLVS